MFWPIFARRLWQETFKSLIFADQSDGELAKRQKKRAKLFLSFTYLHKTQPGQKLLEISRIFFKISARQMFGYPSLDAG